MKASTPKPIKETAGQQCARWLKAAKLKARETNTVLGWDQVAKIIDATLESIGCFQPVKAQNSEVSSLGVASRHVTSDVTKSQLAGVIANLTCNAVCNGPVTPSETGAVSGSEAEPIIAPKVRERNPLFDAIAEAEGSTVTEITKSAGGRIAKALMEIKSVSPDVTVEEIKGRAEAYKRLYPKAACTSTALATHWAKLDSKANSSTAPKPRDYTKL